jgi:hypothetical protein
MNAALAEPAQPTTDQPTPEATGPRVLVAMSAISAELSSEGIGKDRKNEQQNFKFRGIDDVYNAVSPLLPKHGLLILTRTLERTCTVRESKSGGALMSIVLKMEFDFVSVADGSKITVGPFYGEAMDSGDKATNKAMSVAYKYCCFQTFCIPVQAAPDADAQTHEVAGSDGPNLTNEKRDTYLPELVEYITNEDALGFRQLWNELQRREQMGIWYFFSSKQKTTARQMLQNNPDAMK